MKNKKQPLGNINTFFENVVVAHVASIELRDLYRKQFAEYLLQHTKDTYNCGMDTATKIFKRQK